MQPTDVGVGEDVCFGVKTNKEHTVADVVSPAPRSLVQEIVDGQKQGVYASTAKPLGGTLRMRGISVPDAVFGTKTVYVGSAAECLKSEEGDRIPTPGAQTRRYQAFDDSSRFGRPTPHDDAGKNMKKTMTWVTATEDERGTRVRSIRDEEFHAAQREQAVKQLATLHDEGFSPARPVASNASESAAVVMYMRDTEARNPEDAMNTQRGVVASVRHRLKRSGFEKFGELEAAFRAHDINGTGTIDRRRVPSICRLFSLQLSEPLVDELASLCDHEGQVAYVDLVALMDYNRFSHTPAQSMLPHGPTRPGGVPTIRSDKAAPKLRRVCDTTNYGDEGDAGGVLHPPAFAQHGLHASDFLCPRTPGEMRQLFVRVGVQLDDKQFAEVWDRAARLNPAGQVNVESFRIALEG